MDYRLLATATYDKSTKRLSKDAARYIGNEVFTLAANPRRGESLKYEFRGLWSLHLKFNNTHYRVIYSIDDTRQAIELRWVGSRENLYKQVRRLNLRAA